MTSRRERADLAPSFHGKFNGPVSILLRNAGTSASRNRLSAKKSIALDK
jgi:hypothetical protein